MAAGLRKCLDLGPMDHAGEADGNLNNPVIAQRVLDTRTRWIRVWMRWPKAELGPGHYDHGYLGLIDSQINWARDRGIGVVLVNWEFPQWANGTVGADNANHARADRFLGKDAMGNDKLKALTQGIPTGQLGVNGHWGRWINFLINRYQSRGCGVVLEIMNEPNFQWWPQQNSGGSTVSAYKAAEMMHTAAQISAWYGNPIPLAAPAMSDTREGTGRLYTRYNDFLVLLKQGLQSFNFRGIPTFIWSHHNYADVEAGSVAAWNATWNTLVGWWRGWSATAANGSNPGIWITEGGCRLGRVGNNEAAQASRVSAMYQLMLGGSGAAMFTNYLLHSAPGFDTGLLDAYPGDRRRPVWNTFHAMAPNL